MDLVDVGEAGLDEGDVGMVGAVALLDLGEGLAVVVDGGGVVALLAVEVAEALVGDRLVVGFRVEGIGGWGDGDGEGLLVEGLG